MKQISVVYYISGSHVPICIHGAGNYNVLPIILIYLNNTFYYFKLMNR